MGHCKDKGICDFCDARCATYIVDEKDWKEFCGKYNKQCAYEEIKGMQYVDAMEYIENLPSTENKTYKAACEYMARIELFDRSLTDIRNPHNPTEAFIQGKERSASNVIALKVRNGVIRKYHIKSEDLTKEIHRHPWYSAQKWIDEYDRLLGENK